MSQYNHKSFVYRLSKDQNNETQKSQSLDQETIERMLHVLANQSMKDKVPDRKSTRLNSSHSQQSRMPSSA